MNVYARLGLVALCVAAAILLADAPPAQPASLHAVAFAADPSTGLSHNATAPNATVPWDGRPFAVAFLEPLAYDATRDATLAGALVCSHHACGPLVWVKGNHTGGLLSGPFLLKPTSRSFTFEDASQAGRRSSQYDPVRFAIAEPFEMRSPAAPLWGGLALRLAPLLLLAAIPEGAPWWRRNIVVGAVLLGGYWGYDAADESWGALLYMFPIGLVTLVSTLALLGFALFRRRIQPELLAGVALGFAFFLAMAFAGPYAPPAGWGD